MQDENIKKLSDKENKMVKEAHKKHGNVFDNTNSLISLIEDFVYEVDQEKWVFYSFLSQVQKGLYLVLLSILRKHGVQSYLMTRHILESACLACYSLYEKDSDKFGGTDTRGYYKDNENVKKQAYKWLEQNYKSYSDKIENIKKGINKSFAHSNIGNAQRSLNSNLKTTFFDECGVDDEFRLCYLGYITGVLLELFVKVIKDSDAVKVREDSEPKIRELVAESKNISQELINRQGINPLISEVLKECREGKKGEQKN